MPKVRPTTRKERRQEQQANYVAGRGARPYSHSPSLNRSFIKDPAPGPSSERSTQESKVCPRCVIVLSRWQDTFKGFIQQGSELKKRKSINPYPKRSDIPPYRDLNAQNEWLRNNVFDPMGNYLFCAQCICAAFHISPQRIARQRSIKRKQFQEPTKELSKAAIEEQRLGQYVVMPSGCTTNFTQWWRSLDSSESVVVRYPYEKHGNACRVSNSAKPSVMNDFVAFADANSQPNGRSAESHGPTSYFISKFASIQTPAKKVSDYEERVRKSVVGEFCRVQTEAGKGGCSNGSATNWLKIHRPKLAICPHKQDYCDKCAAYNASIHANQTTLNRIRQSGSASVEEQKKLEDEIEDLERSRNEHRTEAQLSHEDYVALTKRCKDEMVKIKTLEEKLDRSEEEEDELGRLKSRYTLVISADYQMSKLVPTWGYSPQPGSTYYLQKLSHDLLGIVNHSDDSSAVYIFDERSGPKNTDHTVSYLTHYLIESGAVPSWVRRIHLYLDNACSTNKNFHTLGWASELVQQDKFNFFRISFMIAGHTKFAPDLLFSKIALTFQRSDVFTTAELGQIAAQYASVEIDDGEKVYQWRNQLEKYSNLPGIRNLHDFVFARNPGSDVKLRV